MESGGSSNQQKRETSASGAVIPEAGSGGSAAANVSTLNAADQNPPPQPQAFRLEAEQYMSMANIDRIMCSVLPPHVNIADDAKEAIQECVSEFIGAITSEAHERSHRESGICPEDVIAAMSSLGFDDYIEPLTLFINNYRDEHPEHDSRSQQPPAAQVAPPPAVAPLVMQEYEVLRDFLTHSGTHDDEASTSGGGN